ncbi:MAG: WG repeat-containing protein, partial [Cyclobacteriaceae bacterium]|nr:WG repeat-containing protein [Cyclobacteriaceae bacterium]
MKTTSILFFLIFCFLQVASGLNHSSSNATAEAFFIIVENGKKGLKNAKGKVVIPPKYENIGWSDGKTSPIDGVIGFQKNGLWGIISVSNKIITDAEYIQLTSNTPYAAIICSKYNLENNKQWFGVLNTKGKMIIPFNYYVLVGVGEYLIAANKSGDEARYGIIDYNHEIVVPITYENIYPISSALLALHTFDG